MPQPDSRVQRILSISLCIALLLPFGRSQAILDLKYVKPLHCPNMALSTQLRYQTRAVRSLLQCLALCRASAPCVSVVHERASDLCHLGSSPAMQNCSNMEPTGPDVNFYEQKVVSFVLLFVYRTGSQGTLLVQRWNLFSRLFWLLKVALFPKD